MQLTQRWRQVRRVDGLHALPLHKAGDALIHSILAKVLQGDVIAKPLVRRLVADDIAADVAPIGVLGVLHSSSSSLPPLLRAYVPFIAGAVARHMSHRGAVLAYRHIMLAIAPVLMNKPTAALSNVALAVVRLSSM